jgi:hypothetical protein
VQFDLKLFFGGVKCEVWVKMCTRICGRTKSYKIDSLGEANVVKIERRSGVAPLPTNFDKDAVGDVKKYPKPAE